MPIFRLLFFMSMLCYCSCQQKTDRQVYDIEIIDGSSTLYGRLTVPDNSQLDSLKISIRVLHPITAEILMKDIQVNPSGLFSVDFDMQTSSSLIGVSTSLDPYKVLMIKANHHDSTRVDITYDSNGNIKNIEVLPYMNKYDVQQGMEVFTKIVSNRPEPHKRQPLSLYNKSIDEFLGVVKRNYTERMALFVGSDDLLSKEFKDFTAKDYRLFLYTGHVFNYVAEMKRNYRITTQDTIGLSEMIKIDRSYFRFLKDFNLNDPQYLHAYTFPEFQDSILNNKVLGLPILGERDIQGWIIEVKSILVELLGFSAGPYYDILAANALAEQLKKEKRPFSEKQIEHINQYWKDGEIPKILLRKNEQVVKIDQIKSPAVVHDVNAVPKDKILDIILSNHRNKVVLIDFWATWCGPCLVAIREFDAIKGNYSNKNVAFVYLTNGSSPKDLWTKNIIGIGNDHYYLDANQWEYLMEKFQFTHIPSYLLFDTQGMLNEKFTSFPGNDVIQQKLAKLLKNKT